MAPSPGPPGEPAAEPPRKPRVPRKKPVSSPEELRVRLLAHVERQIARFDAALDAEAPPAGFDSAKVLRDLRGLKDLLDALRIGDGGGDGVGGPLLDLVALRAEIARRYAAFAARGPDRGLPEPSLPGASASPGE